MPPTPPVNQNRPFKMDYASIISKEYIKKYTRNYVNASISNIDGITIKSDLSTDTLIDINEANFVAANASFINGTVIVGEADADHAVFGSSDGTRSVTTRTARSLVKSSYISITSVCGESYGGSIELPEDPDGNEDLVVEISVDNTNFVRLLGRITEKNSSTSSYIEHRFCMPEADDDYYIRITQTDHSGDGLDYYAFKDFKINIISSIFDPVNKINVF